MNRAKKARGLSDAFNKESPDPFLETASDLLPNDFMDVLEQFHVRFGLLIDPIPPLI
ncbi:MAG: hypothetical protein R3F19_11990 [Verrucomicrobiales bacterium]